MAAKYNYSRKLGNETFQVVNCDSFDEAIKIVEKGIKDRILSDPLRPFKENPFEEMPAESAQKYPLPTYPSCTTPFINDSGLSLTPSFAPENPPTIPKNEEDNP